MSPTRCSSLRAWSYSSLCCGIVTIALVGCSAQSLPEELVASSAELLVDRTDSVDLVLSGPDAECAVRRLDAGQAASLEDEELPPMAAVALADAIVECVGGDVIARTALAPFTSGASGASLACAGDRLDDDLISELVAGRLSGEPVPRAEVELAVVAAVSLCLDPDELRGRG